MQGILFPLILKTRLLVRWPGRYRDIRGRPLQRAASLRFTRAGHAVARVVGAVARRCQPCRART
jgi:hypothetical protein